MVPTQDGSDRERSLGFLARLQQRFVASLSESSASEVDGDGDPARRDRAIDQARLDWPFLVHSRVRCLSATVWRSRIHEATRCLVSADELSELHPRMGSYATQFTEFYSHFSSGHRFLQWLLVGGDAHVAVHGGAQPLQLVVSTLQALLLSWLSNGPNDGLTLQALACRLARRDASNSPESAGSEQQPQRPLEPLRNLVRQELESLTNPAHPVRVVVVVACASRWQRV